MKVQPEIVTQKALSLFRQKGFSATSMADIAQECGILKGSLYGHFSSKNEILYAAIDSIFSYFKEDIFLKEEGLSDKQKLSYVFLETREYFIKNKVCVFAHLAMDDIDDVGKNKIKEFFIFWKSQLSLLISKIMPDENSEELAEDIIISIEGAVLWLHINDDPEPLKRIFRKYEQTILK